RDRTAFRQVLEWRARATRAGIAGLIAVLYVLDTDMVIFMLRGLKVPARQRARREKALSLVAHCRAAQARGDVVGLSAITVSELEFGAYKSGDYDTEIVAVRKILTPFEVFDYDGTTCPTHYGRIRHELEQDGRAYAPDFSGIWASTVNR